eukprot:4613161-Prymnesium_polylepis.1
MQHRARAIYQYTRGPARRLPASIDLVCDLGVGGVSRPSSDELPLGSAAERDTTRNVMGRPSRGC